MKTRMRAGTPLLIGTVIAATSVTQDNYGGAAFALVATGCVEIWMLVASRKKSRKN